jgi:histone H3/H4
MNQPNFFAEKIGERNKIILFALGEFQSRKKVLAERELPLDRLRGAFKRACEKFENAEFTDEELVEYLEKLGAKITKVANFVAKHPFRVTVPNNLAEKSLKYYQEVAPL